MTNRQEIADHIRKRIAKSQMESPAVNVSREGWAEILALLTEPGVVQREPPYLLSPEREFLGSALIELKKARAKFPTQDVWRTLAALTEEVGELNQAILQFHDEPLKGVTMDAIHKEARQVIVMALRVIFDAGLESGIVRFDTPEEQAWQELRRRDPGLDAEGAV